jgi:hypothetical protein
MNKPTAKDQTATMAALSQTAAAWLVGVSSRTFRDTDAPRESDGTYNARSLVAWIKGKATADTDPLLIGGDSPNLERYRAAKAELAELDAAERRGRMVDVDALREWWGSEIAGPLKRAIQVLESQHGKPAADLIANALRKAEATMEKRTAHD